MDADHVESQCVSRFRGGEEVLCQIQYYQMENVQINQIRDWIPVGCTLKVPNKIPHWMTSNISFHAQMMPSWLSTLSFNFLYRFILTVGGKLVHSDFSNVHRYPTFVIYLESLENIQMGWCNIRIILIKKQFLFCYTKAVHLFISWNFWLYMKSNNQATKES